MKRRALLLAAVLLAGCSAPIPPVSLKASCDALGVALAEFGQAAPTTQRYSEISIQVKAIRDRGDATTKEALQPLVEALEKGTQGATMEALGAQVAATLPLALKCAAVGSSLTPASASPSASASSAPVPSAETTPLPISDFTAAINELSRECTGDACHASVRIAVGFVGVDDPLGPVTVTYTVFGGTAPVSRTVSLDADLTAVEEFMVDVAKDNKLYISVAHADEEV